MITKYDNPEVIRIYTKMARKEDGVVIRFEDLREAPPDLHKPSKKRKQVAYDTQKSVQKPPKKKVVKQKEIEKEVKEVIASTILIPSKTRSGRTPQKVSSSSVTSDVPVKKKQLRKMVIPAEVEEEEEEEEKETMVSLIKMNCRC